MAGTTLLVCSAGGHLTQLRLLAPRLTPPIEAVTWVSYDDPQARSALVGCHVVPGHGPSTRHLPNAFRNLRAAHRLLDGGHVDRVISTGAGIAVPFLLEAVHRGASAHYVESATRAQGPSLSGRILQDIAPQVRLYTQHREWADARWIYAGSVYEGYTPLVPRQDARDRPLKILVSLGTHRRYRFPELVRAVAAAIQPGDDLVWQLGVTDPPAGQVGQFAAQIPTKEMVARIRWADAVVAHAGTGIVLSCLESGKHPVIVPRRRHRGEHVDDHQVVTAEAVSRLGLATWSEPDALTRDVIRTAARLGCVRDRAPDPFVLASAHRG